MFSQIVFSFFICDTVGELGFQNNLDKQNGQYLMHNFNHLVCNLQLYSSDTKLLLGE